MSEALRRIGIMGGTFDPIHFGHLHCAERAKDALALDEVIFIPAGDPAFKQGAEIADGADRLAMCELAVADNEAFSVSDIELERDGITFTVDTLEELHERMQPSTELVFIIGSDSLEYLSEWRNPQRLAALARFACVVRPGYDFDRSMLDSLAADGFRIDIVEAPLLDISSTQIRAMCKEGFSIRYLTPYSVCEYIEENGLYGRFSSQEQQ